MREKEELHHQVLEEKGEEVRDLVWQLEKAGRECDTFATRTRELDYALTTTAREGKDCQEEAESLRQQRDDALIKQQEAEEAFAQLRREWKD